MVNFEHVIAGWTFVQQKLGEDWFEAKVLPSQPKMSGVNKDWVNVQMEGNSKPSGVDWTKMSFWEEVESRGAAVYLSCKEELLQETLDAKEKELSKLKKNDVFEVVLSASQQAI